MAPIPDGGYSSSSPFSALRKPSARAFFVEVAAFEIGAHRRGHLAAVMGERVLDDLTHVDEGETLRFEPAPAPTRAELTSKLERIYARVMKWLARRGLLRNPDDADASNAPPELSSAEALTTAGMQRGTLLTVRESGDSPREDDPAIASPPPPRVTDAVTHERFNLHASVHLHAHDDLGRERLCR